MVRPESSGVWALSSVNSVGAREHLENDECGEPFGSYQLVVHLNLKIGMWRREVGVASSGEASKARASGVEDQFIVRRGAVCLHCSA